MLIKKEKKRKDFLKLNFCFLSFFILLSIIAQPLKLWSVARMLCIIEALNFEWGNLGNEHSLWIGSLGLPSLMPFRLFVLGLVLQHSSSGDRSLPYPYPHQWGLHGYCHCCVCPGCVLDVFFLCLCMKWKKFIGNATCRVWWVVDMSGTRNAMTDIADLHNL